MKPSRIEVFDPPMCCSSSVCGRKVGHKLVQFSAALDWLRGQGLQVERYNLGHHYNAFAGNGALVRAISEHGLNCLPLMLVNGRIVSWGEDLAQKTLAAKAGLSRAGVPPENLGAT